jgi:CHRD domain
MRRVRSLIVAVAIAALAWGVVSATPATAEPPADRNFVTHLSGDEEVPARETSGKGLAVFHISKDGTSIDYKLIVTSIDNVFAAHIHLAPMGVNGPIVAFLFEGVPAGGRHNGLLAEGTITSADLVGPLLGQPLSTLIVPMQAGNAYVNVHTNDGVEPIDTGPGDFPAGEIRGQI